MKKLFLFLLCFLILTINVNAESIINTSDTIKGAVDPNSYLITDTVGISIEENDNYGNVNDTLQLYKIINSYYNSSTNIITYEFTDQFKTFLASTTNSDNDHSGLTADGYIALTGATQQELNSGSTTLSNELNTLATLYAKYIRENSISPSYNYGIDTNDGIEVGSYLIFSKESYSHIYAIMVANAQYKANNGVWTLEDVSIIAKASPVGGAIYIDQTGNFESIHAIGEVFNYLANVIVPIYPTNATSSEFTMKAFLSDGIELSDGLKSVIFSSSNQNFVNKGDGQILDSITNEIVATMTYIDNVLTISLVTENVIDRSLSITMASKLNSSAVIGGDGNISNFYYSYSNDPYGNGSSVAEIKSENIHKVYTYGLKIKYTDKDDPTKFLTGATFNLYSVNDTDFNLSLGTLTIDEDGNAILTGITPGAYILKQTKSVAGYRLNSNQQFAFTDSDLDEFGYYNLSVVGAKAGFLPSTGGIGTIMFSIFGILLIILACVSYVLYKKRMARFTTKI